MRHSIRALGLIALGAILGCDSSLGPAEPRLVDVARAHQAWAATDARDYSFDLTTTSMAGTHTRRVVVFNRHEVPPDTDSVPSYSYAPSSIDDLWRQILAAVETQDLNSAVFDARGIPIVADMGYWPLDGGVRYAVSNFVRTR